ncbi:MAG: hypothetical protein LBU60_05350, partial [Clostridiales bacterium]|nr:hypothetical protein [Clostridiales bacterium]
MGLVFLYSVLSGLVGTTIGALIVVLIVKMSNKLIAYLLALSAGCMVSVSVFQLIPSSFSVLLDYDYSQKLSIFFFSFFIVIGMFFTSCLVSVAGVLFKASGYFKI